MSLLKSSLHLCISNTLKYCSRFKHGTNFFSGDSEAAVLVPGITVHNPEAVVLGAGGRAVAGVMAVAAAVTAAAAAMVKRKEKRIHCRKGCSCFVCAQRILQVFGPLAVLVQSPQRMH